MSDWIWVTAAGHRVPISEMTDSHLQYSINKIERSKTGWRRAWLDRLLSEQFIRKAREASVKDSLRGYRRCRLCGCADFGLLKYGLRHYAHHNCYLKAGKKLTDLPQWKIVEFPFFVLKKHGLAEEALRLTVAFREKVR